MQVKTFNYGGAFALVVVVGMAFILAGILL